MKIIIGNSPFRFRSAFVCQMWVIMILCSSTSAASLVTVAPSNMNGWVIGNQGDFVAPFEFTVGPGDPPLGIGSLNVGPIGSLAANKFILFPPIQNIDVVDLSSFSFDFYLSSTPTMSPNQFYVNVYIDLPQNGLGVFDSSFYDCRFDLVAGGALPSDTWNTVSFNGSSVWTVINDQTTAGNLCSTTLASLAANSKIMFIALNAGDTSPSDVGLVGAFDNVITEIDGQTIIYDFEPNLETCFVGKAKNSKTFVYCL